MKVLNLIQQNQTAGGTISVENFTQNYIFKFGILYTETATENYVYTLGLPELSIGQNESLTQLAKKAQEQAKNHWFGFAVFNKALLQG